jgi:hypothetical protein
MRHRLDVGEQRTNPLMEGIHHVTPIPMPRDEVSYGGFELVVDLATDDMLIEHVRCGGLLAIEVHRGSGA